MLKGKRRELKRREQLFLETARDLMVERGFHGITMGAVADATGFAKGTLYLKFPTKEELVGAVWLRSQGILSNMIERAFSFAGGTRERMVSAGLAVEIFAQSFPQDAAILPMLEAERVLQVLPPNCLEPLRRAHERQSGLLAALAQEAVEIGDLAGADPDEVQHLAFALWKMVDGCFATIAANQPSDDFGVKAPFGAIWQVGDRLLDAYGWQPLSTALDYWDTRRQVAESLFPECARPPSLAAFEGGVPRRNPTAVN